MRERERELVELTMYVILNIGRNGVYVVVLYIGELWANASLMENMMLVFQLRIASRNGMEDFISIWIFFFPYMCGLT